MSNKIILDVDAELENIMDSIQVMQSKISSINRTDILLGRAKTFEGAPEGISNAIGRIETAVATIWCFSSAIRVGLGGSPSKSPRIELLMDKVNKMYGLK